MYEILDLKKMDEYAQGLSNYIRRGEEMVATMRVLAQSLDEIRKSREDQYLYEIRQMREELKMLTQHLANSGMSPIDVYGYKMDKLRSLVHTDEWPQAVDPDYIAVGDEAKQVTAKHILDLIVTESLDNLKFLDFGCGGGFVAHEAANRNTLLSVGYDPKENWRCSPVDRFFLTSNLEEVRDNGPYDIILMYDVLDHCEDAVKVLCEAKELLSSRGRLYVRNHPWCSKHGGHLYEHINKAYLHVIFDELEQMRLFGRSSEYVQKLPYPLTSYKEWFYKSGLEIISENITRDHSIPTLFSTMENTYIQERLAQYWKGCDHNQHISINFVTYLLESSKKDFL